MPLFMDDMKKSPDWYWGRPVRAYNLCEPGKLTNGAAQWGLGI